MTTRSANEGEHLDADVRLVVAPCSGKFVPSRAAATGGFVAVGDPVGEVRSLSARAVARSKFHGRVMGLLAAEGSRVRRNEVLAWLATGATAQWTSADLPWDLDVDEEALAARLVPGWFGPESTADVSGTAVASWGDEEWRRFSIESRTWALSQFLHREQGAVRVAAKVGATVPWDDARAEASTRAVDEARHAEVFSRYLDTKTSGQYRINAHLEALIDDVVTDSRWDVTVLGMQTVLEAMALASLRLVERSTTEPLLKQLLRLVMADERRHVDAGVQRLHALYRELTSAELHDRQAFVFEAATRIQDELLLEDVFERLGVGATALVPKLRRAPDQVALRAAFFSKIVASCDRIGLLDANDRWLRDRFVILGVMPSPKSAPALAARVAGPADRDSVSSQVPGGWG